jgi:hypothetical protein
VRPVSEVDKRARALEEETREMRVKIENAEDAKMELLAMLDRKYESGEEVISELFASKREVQEKLEDVKRKVCRKGGRGKKGE